MKIICMILTKLASAGLQLCLSSVVITQASRTCKGLPSSCLCITRISRNFQRFPNIIWCLSEDVLLIHKHFEGTKCIFFCQWCRQISLNALLLCCKWPGGNWLLSYCSFNMTNRISVFCFDQNVDRWQRDSEKKCNRMF